MSKLKILPKVLSLLTAGVTLCSVSGCKKNDKRIIYVQEVSYSSKSSLPEEYEVIKNKKKLSDELINLINSYDDGLIYYMNNYTDFSNGYVLFESVDDCIYFSNLSSNQKKAIYDFSYSYYEYLKYFQNNDIEEVQTYITRMVNKSREFSSISILRYSVNERLKDDSYNYLFNQDNVLPLIESDDYNDYITILNKNTIFRNNKKLSIDNLKGDIIDKEIAESILCIHLLFKYSIDPLFALKCEDGKTYLANLSDLYNYSKNNNDKNIINLSLEKEGNRWFLKVDNDIFKIVKTNSLNAYLTETSNKYHKDSFSYKEMIEYGLLQMVLEDQEVLDYSSHDEQSDIEEYWWPIGSSEIEVIDGVEYAKGEPEETFKVNKYDYIFGLNGVGVTNIIASKSGIVVYPTDEEQKYYGLDNKGEKYGNYVVIKHFDDSYTLYSHLSYDSISVMSGDFVSQGQVIGKMGNTGDALDNYLEFEIRVKNNTEDSKVNIYDYVSVDNPRGENVKIK